MKRNLMKLATVAALAAGMAMAQGPEGAPPATAPNTAPNAAHATARQRFMAMRQRFMQALNLTDAQRAQAKAIFQKARTSVQPVRQELRQNHQAMLEAVHNDNEAAIRTLSRAQADLRSQVVASRNVALAQFYKILTPEQRAKADQMHQAMRQRFEQRRAAASRG